MSEDYFKISEPQKNFLVLFWPDDHDDCCRSDFQVYCLHWSCFLQVIKIKFKSIKRKWTGEQTKLTFTGEMSGCCKRSELWLKLIFALVLWMCCCLQADRQPVGCVGIVHHPVIVTIIFQAPALLLFIHPLFLDKTRKLGWSSRLTLCLHEVNKKKKVEPK